MEAVAKKDAAQKGLPKTEQTPERRVRMLGAASGSDASGRPRTDTIVTARVPIEIKEQGNAVLKKIGATPTELVNAAYQYVLSCGELPEAFPSLREVADRRRLLTSERKLKMKDRVVRMTLKAPASWEGKTYEQLREDAMRERYPEYFG